MLVVFKLLDMPPVLDWPWWGILSPFGAALAWWFWSDSTGLTKRKEMEKLEEKKRKRRAGMNERMGLDEKGRPLKR
jgi:small Trp-rich protein